MIKNTDKPERCDDCGRRITKWDADESMAEFEQKLCGHCIEEIDNMYESEQDEDWDE